MTEVSGMSCTDIQERLPWQLNGSLDDAERREVEDHLALCTDCQAELTVVREASELYAAHPPAEDLVDYALGRAIEGPSRGALEGHLAYCATCVEEVALVQQDRLAMGVAVVGHSSDSVQLDTAVTVDSAVAASASQTHWRTLALAASLVAGLGVGGLIWQGQRSVPPATNIAIIELLPESYLTRDGSSANEAVDSTHPAAMIFVTDRVETYDGARIRFADRAGTVAWESEGLEANETGDFTVLLPAGALHSGQIIVTIETRRDGAWSVFETYRLVISP